MTRCGYNTIDDTRPEAILPALIEALKEGKKGVQIISGLNSRRIVDIPDKNEVLALREIIEDYKKLTDAGNTLILDGEQDNVRAFVNGLLSVTELAEQQDVPFVRKKRPDVENELVLSFFKTWDSVLEESSNQDASYYGIVWSNDVDEMRAVFRNAVSAQLFDSSTSEDDFLYYFGRLSSVSPRGKLKWLGSQVELTAFIMAFSGDAYQWEKAERIFLARKKDGSYQSVVSDVLKQTYSRDDDQGFGKAKDRVREFRKKLLPCEEPQQS